MFNQSGLKRYKTMLIPFVLLRAIAYGVEKGDNFEIVFV